MHGIVFSPKLDAWDSLDLWNIGTNFPKVIVIKKCRTKFPVPKFQSSNFAAE